MQVIPTMIETQSLLIEVPIEQALCIETLERAILGQFPAQTQLLRWAIVAKIESTTMAIAIYRIEATVQRVR
jgi:hypothetical protein